MNKGVNTAMPRPKGSKNKPKPKQTRAMIAKHMDENTPMACTRCATLKAKKHFYESFDNPMQPTGRVPYCKDCLKIMISDKKGIVTLDKVQDALQKIDKPFLYDLWRATLDSKAENVFGMYMKNLQMPQTKYLAWRDSTFQPQITKLNYDGVDDRVYNNNSNDTNGDNDNENDDTVGVDVRNMTMEPNNVVVDYNLSVKWGISYDNVQIQRLEKFYNEMITSHYIITPQHKQILKFICKLNLKMDECLEADDLNNFAKLSQQYEKLLSTSGLRPIDKTSSNVNVGIKNFSSIFEEVEKDGYIKPAPIEENQDIIDRTIMYILNYTLKLLNANQFISPPLDTPKMKDGDLDG
jgi:hypothetical protein